MEKLTSSFPKFSRNLLPKSAYQRLVNAYFVTFGFNIIILRWPAEKKMQNDLVRYFFQNAGTASQEAAQGVNLVWVF
jgi:hypothetical protein